MGPPVSTGSRGVGSPWSCSYRQLWVTRQGFWVPRTQILCKSSMFSKYRPSLQPHPLFWKAKGLHEIPYVSQNQASNFSLYSMINTFSSKSFFHSKLAMLSCLSILKITLPLFLWLLQRPPRGPWSPENWPRTTESILAKNYWKRHSSGIENKRSPGRQHMGKITSELSWPATDACVLHVWKWHYKQWERAQDCPPRYLRQKVLVQDNA